LWFVGGGGGGKGGWPPPPPPPPGPGRAGNPSQRILALAGGSGLPVRARLRGRVVGRTGPTLVGRHRDATAALRSHAASATADPLAAATRQ
jgi:hypothetical protein